MKKAILVNLGIFIFLLAGCGRDTSPPAAQAYLSPDKTAEMAMKKKPKPPVKRWYCSAYCTGNCLNHNPVEAVAPTQAVAGRKAIQLCKAQNPSRQRNCLMVPHSCKKH
jgi:hypothetical protein